MAYNPETYKKYYYGNRERLLEKRKADYRLNRETYLERNRASRRKREPINRHKRQAVLSEYKMERGGCAMCGYSVSPAALDMHHRLPENKERRKNRWWKRPIGQYRKELDEQCVVLCANCHRIIHSNLSED